MPATPLVRTVLILCLLIAAAVGAAPLQAQQAERMRATPAASDRVDGAAVMTVATRHAPPFAIRHDDGSWSGLAINLWREIAEERGLAFRFEETDLDGMISGVADGRFDASVGAITVTPSREERVDFLHPYYSTGFAIAVGQGPTNWLILVRNFFTWGFLQAVLALSALLLVVGLLFWLAERKQNAEEFGGSVRRGIGAGFWFSAVTMTTVGYGDKAPRTMAGKMVALVWMFGAIIIISTFTGMIASSLTEGRLSGSIQSTEDLVDASVASINDSASEEWLSESGIGFDHVASIEDGLTAVAEGQADAFVYDRPLLRYLLRTSDYDDVELVPGSFGRQDYAFALPPESPLREPLNRALLARIEGFAWSNRIRQVLGPEE